MRSDPQRTAQIARGKTVRPAPVALEFSRDIARELSEGLDELVVRIGRVISYQELNANQPAQRPGGVMGGRAPASSPLRLEARGGQGRRQRYNRGLISSIHGFGP